MKFEKLNKTISKERKIINEIEDLMNSFNDVKNEKERRLIIKEIKELKKIFKEINSEFIDFLAKISFVRQLKPVTSIIPVIKKPLAKPKMIVGKAQINDLSELERITLERIKTRKKGKKEVKIKKPSLYLKISNEVFSNISAKFIDNPFFRTMKRDLIKTNLEILPKTYLSMILFTTMLSFFISIFGIIFFLFFNFVVQVPFIVLSGEAIGMRFLKTFWIMFVLPMVTFFVIYIYPFLEKQSTESGIDQEIPFATIHMSAIAGSLIDPTNIFKIIVSTKEYPNISKEFIKLLNQINIHGLSLVNSLKITAFNSASVKLSELLNGLSTTINSGGDLPNFFEKRSETLLMEHRLEREKEAKSSETFMDIYISVVIAAPMILMLLLIMMRVSGLGISLSTTMISIVMVLGVSVINAVFLTFLQLKQKQ